MRNNLPDNEILSEQSQIWQQVKNYLLERMKEILEAIIEGERDRYIQERGGKEPATGDAV